MPRLLLPVDLLLHGDRGQATELYFVDSTKLAPCHNARISRNRVVRGLAQRGRTAMGWFFGFKLHLWSFTTRARSWPSRSQGAIPMTGTVGAHHRCSRGATGDPFPGPS